MNEQVGNPGDLGTLLLHLRANTAQYQRALSDARSTTRSTATVLAQHMKMMGAAVTAAFTTIAAVSVRAFASFENEMVKSTAIMGDLNASMRKEMELTARQIATNSVTSADELAKSYYYLASAGLSAEASIAALGAVEKFAVAGAFDMARATDLLTDAQSALGMSSKDAAVNLREMVRLSDVLMKANVLANASTEQFSIALTAKAGSALRNVNKDVEEGVAVLAAYADQGIKAELAGERLSIMLRDLQTANLTNRGEWDRLSLSVYDSHGAMLPLVDIIKQLETRLGPMSTEMKKSTLELLGFNDRSVMAVQSLFGFSDKIRGIEVELRRAGNTTRDVADRQLQSFSNQMTILKNRVRDVFLTIGESLVPILKVFIGQIDGAYKSTEGFSNQVQQLGDWFHDTSIKIIAAFEFMKHGLDAFVQGFRLGWLLIAEGVMIAMEKVIKYAADAPLKATTSIANAVVGVWNTSLRVMTDALNASVTAAETYVNTIVGIYDRFLPGKFGKVEFGRFEAPEIGKIEPPNFRGFLDELDAMRGAVSETRKEVVAELEKLSNVNPWATAMSKLDQTQQVREADRATTKAMKSLSEYFAEFDKQIEESPHRKALAELRKYFDNLDMLMEGVREKPLVTPQMREFENFMSSPLTQAMEAIAKFDELLAENQISAEQYAVAVKYALEQASELFAPVAPTGIAEVDQMATFLDQQRLLEESHNRQIAEIESFYERKRELGQMTEELERQRLERLAQAEEGFTKRTEAFQFQRQQLILQTAQATFASLADAARDFAGEQSGVYKAMFAISKAFAIAESIVAIQTGIAKASSLQFPLNLAAMASVAAATASLVSNIMAVSLSFEGGGLTPVGSRSGGLDGRGGFTAILHPNEKVVDLTQERDERQEASYLNITYNIESGVTRNELAPILEVHARRVKGEISDALRRGGSAARQFTQR
jgi:TP901 family phage tail tape measure protein